MDTNKIKEFTIIIKFGKEIGESQPSLHWILCVFMTSDKTF